MSGKGRCNRMGNEGKERRRRKEEDGTCAAMDVGVGGWYYKRTKERTTRMTFMAQTGERRTRGSG